MQLLIFDTGLFKDASQWKSNFGPDINDPPSLLFLPTQTDDGSMLVHNALGEDWAGGLISLTHSLPRHPCDETRLLPYSAWRFNFRFIGETYKNLARFENDIKVCIKTRPDANTKIRNVANYSTQWNRDTGQMQLDHDPPKWLDSGMFITDEMSAPDVWHVLDYRFSFDETALTFSIESMQWDETFFLVPDEHKNVPLSETNWEECDKHQLQNEGYKPGTVLVEYDDGIRVWSDQPIGDLPL